MTTPTVPRRVQRTRTPGQRGMPPGARYVGRGTRWGNPFRVIPHRKGGGKLWQVIDTGDRSSVLRDRPLLVRSPAEGRATATRLFAQHTSPGGLYAYTDDDLAELRKTLAGVDLACWCPLPSTGQPDWCHAAHLLTLANPDPFPTD
ncbi:DUF4326 domain-containing protein [Streptomyces althioticus]|uniref:DUF4326 domain-containing protein n=1 Tax=Streptomyces althioticus TaxID=83380 RepID=UPI00340973DB